MIKQKKNASLLFYISIYFLFLYILINMLLLNY